MNTRRESIAVRRAYRQCAPETPSVDTRSRIIPSTPRSSALALSSRHLDRDGIGCRQDPRQAKQGGTRKLSPPRRRAREDCPRFIRAKNNPKALACPADRTFSSEPFASSRRCCSQSVRAAWSKGAMGSPYPSRPTAPAPRRQQGIRPALVTRRPCSSLRARRRTLEPEP